MRYHAYNGTSEFEGIKFDKERAVFSVHSEPFTVIARKDANINSFDDLKGRRVNVGNPGSGQLATMEVVMGTKGWTMEDFSLVLQLKSAEQAAALGDNKVDANLVTVDGPEIEKLIADNAYYANATVPGGMYAGNPDDVQTFGVKATFVASADVDEDTIYPAMPQIPPGTRQESQKILPVVASVCIIPLANCLSTVSLIVT